MKNRIASSIALAAGLALGLTGCNLIAPQSTLQEYAPSDGIDLNVEGVALRNVLLIADESGESFNVVFSSVNRTGAPVDLTIAFNGEGSTQGTAEVEIPEGVTVFGDPNLDQEVVVVELDNVIVGSMVNAYFQAGSASEAETPVPVLDGTLAEYRPLVLPAGFQSEEGQDEAAEEELTDEAALEEAEGQEQ